MAHGLLGSTIMARMVSESVATTLSWTLEHETSWSRLAVRHDDNVVDVSKFPPDNKRRGQKMSKRRIGLGVTVWRTAC